MMEKNKNGTQDRRSPRRILSYCRYRKSLPNPWDILSQGLSEDLWNIKDRQNFRKKKFWKMKSLYTQSPCKLSLQIYFYSLFFLMFFYYLLYRSVNLVSFLSGELEHSNRQENEPGDRLGSCFLASIKVECPGFRASFLSYDGLPIVSVDYEGSLLPTFLLPFSKCSPG